LNNTHCKTIFEFYDIYAGPQFLTHYKFAIILALISVVFFYGAVMPILFPMGFVAIYILYSVERLMVYYSYQTPPKLDASMTKGAIMTLYMGPCLMMVGSLAFSNLKVFRNHVKPQEIDQIFTTSDNRIYYTFTELTPATPLGIFAIFFLFMAVGKTIRYFKKADMGTDIFSWIFAQQSATVANKDLYHYTLPSYSDSLKLW